TRGDVVMIDWAYSDRTGSKVRPAVVVQADFLNGLIDDTVLVLVTRTSRGPGTTEVQIDPAMETGSGLRFVSVGSCSNLPTTDPALVIRTIGSLSAAAMQQIDAALKLALGLP